MSHRSGTGEAVWRGVRRRPEHFSKKPLRDNRLTLRPQLLAMRPSSASHKSPRPPPRQAIAPRTLACLNELAFTLESSPEALHAEEIDQLAAACSRVLDLLDNAQDSGEDEPVSSASTPRTAGSSSMVAKFRREHDQARNSRIERRRPAFGARERGETAEDIEALLLRMGLVGTAQAPAPSAFAAAGGDEKPLRGPRRHAASLQSIRHAQRRGGGIDMDEVNSALKAAERALGMES